MVWHGFEKRFTPGENYNIVFCIFLLGERAHTNVSKYVQVHLKVFCQHACLLVVYTISDTLFIKKKQNLHIHVSKSSHNSNMGVF